MNERVFIHGTYHIVSLIREFKIYNAMVAKTSFKIASSSLSVFFVIFVIQFM